MTQIPKRQSSDLEDKLSLSSAWHNAWWALLLSLSAVLIIVSPVVLPPAPARITSLYLLAHLFILLIAATWMWKTVLWGLVITFWASGLVVVVALAARSNALFGLLPIYALTACLSYEGLQRWQSSLQKNRIDEERMQGKINTLEKELEQLQEGAVALRTRGLRYRKLREIANALSATLSQEELAPKIVEATGDLIEEGDVVLLYLVTRRTLSLELKAVWRRSGATMIKAKQGDPFDHWVMRQAQPLLVQEPNRDFRFPSGLPGDMGRPVGSLLAVPLATAHRLIGVLRVESSRSRALNADALRLTRIVGDLASLSIENSRLYHRMEELAITDDLTGLAVRLYFEKRLQEALSRSAVSKSVVSMLLIDIDRFKIYNDTYGHSAGDKLLKHIAQLLIKDRRPGEVVARFGGEELACLLPGVSLEDAVKRAEQIRQSTADAMFQLRRVTSQVTVSIGVSTAPQDGSGAMTLIKTADDRLYRAKSLGRNQVCGASS